MGNACGFAWRLAIWPFEIKKMFFKLCPTMADAEHVKWTNPSYSFRLSKLPKNGNHLVLVEAKQPTQSTLSGFVSRPLDKKKKKRKKGAARSMPGKRPESPSWAGCRCGTTRRVVPRMFNETTSVLGLQVFLRSLNLLENIIDNQVIYTPLYALFSSETRISYFIIRTVNTIQREKSWSLTLTSFLVVQRHHETQRLLGKLIYGGIQHLAHATALLFWIFFCCKGAYLYLYY